MKTNGGFKERTAMNSIMTYQESQWAECIITLAPLAFVAMSALYIPLIGIPGLQPAK